MDATVLYLLGGILYLIAGSLYFEWRVRRIRARIIPDARKSLQKAFFDLEDVDDGKRGKVQILRPNDSLKAIMAATVPPFIEYALQTVKMKLPKFAPINPATGALDFTAGIAAKLADGRNVKPEEIVKSLFMQFGVPLIQEKLAPMIQGVLQGAGAATKGGVKPSEKTENPYLKELEAGAR